jgi:ABC-type transporter lipoprotein component MlaA
VIEESSGVTAGLMAAIGNVEAVSKRLAEQEGGQEQSVSPSEMIRYAYLQFFEQCCGSGSA